MPLCSSWSHGLLPSMLESARACVPSQVDPKKGIEGIGKEGCVALVKLGGSGRAATAQAGEFVTQRPPPAPPTCDFRLRPSHPRLAVATGTTHTQAVLTHTHTVASSVFPLITPIIHSRSLFYILYLATATSPTIELCVFSRRLQCGEGFFRVGCAPRLRQPEQPPSHPDLSPAHTPLTHS